MKNQIINYLITECSLDNRIYDGMFDPFNSVHMDVLIEKLYESEIPYEDIKEFTNKIVEGKYPERQAYNKEGFLVTFPTPDYKTKALASGNYFNYDPTNGKGGMHLIKKAEPTQVQPAPPAQGTPVPAQQPPAQQTPPAPEHQNSPENTTSKIKTTPDTGAQQATPPSSVPPPNAPAPKPEDNAPAQVPTSSSPENSKPNTDVNVNKNPEQYGTGEPEGTPLDLTDFSAYKDPSLEWAHNQKWEKKDNGNYYDTNGNLRAVIGLDGKAVPATEQDRNSLRTWLDKKRKERLPGEKL